MKKKILYNDGLLTPRKGESMISGTQKSNPIIGERGIALVIALGFITIFALLAGGFASISIRNTQVGSDFHYSSEALSSAEAGVHFAIGQMNAGEIVPPEPDLNDPEADSIWRNWVDSLDVPGYKSKVQVAYAETLMLPYFEIGGRIDEENKFYRITSTGEGPHKTSRAIEVITRPVGLGGPQFQFAFHFGSDANFSGSPVTFSGHHDTLTVKLDGGRPFIDSNNNGVFDKGSEWGWIHGTYQLEDLMLNDSDPDSNGFFPAAEGLHSQGDIHANGDMNFNGHPHFNGKGTSTGFISQQNNNPFQNNNNRYFRNEHTNYTDTVEIQDIPTDSAYWVEVAQEESTVYFVTPANVDSFPGWQYVGGKFKWSGNNPIPEGIYYFTDDVQISGNPTGDATIITNNTIKVSGNPTDFGADDMMGYIAGGDITINGDQYLQGFVYTHSDINFSGTPCIFGAVWVKGGGSISGNPFIIFDTALKNWEGLIQTYKPAVISWQEVYE
ncbi:pilus assembly PilX N-terminal domain-containing protein [candidate division TA06 bacterium]|nr:pilus assembly PilX N-terminal domain-containing protein [candidate division TA06 bacterium]